MATGENIPRDRDSKLQIFWEGDEATRPVIFVLRNRQKSPETKKSRRQVLQEIVLLRYDSRKRGLDQFGTFWMDALHSTHFVRPTRNRDSIPQPTFTNPQGSLAEFPIAVAATLLANTLFIANLANVSCRNQKTKDYQLPVKIETSRTIILACPYVAKLPNAERIVCARNQDSTFPLKSKIKNVVLVISLTSFAALQPINKTPTHSIAVINQDAKIVCRRTLAPLLPFSPVDFQRFYLYSLSFVSAFLQARRFQKRSKGSQDNMQIRTSIHRLEASVIFGMYQIR